jgi:hypothetical protein
MEKLHNGELHVLCAFPNIVEYELYRGVNKRMQVYIWKKLRNKATW